MWIALLACLLVLLQVSLGVTMIATASVAANRKLNACNQNLAVVLRAVGRSCVALGIWGLVAVPVAIVMTAFHDALDAGAISLYVVSLIYSALILVGGRLQCRVAALFLAPRTIDEERRDEWRISLLKSVGWTLAMMPVGMPLGILVGFYFLIVAIFGTGSRVHQESLLLILAIAVRTREPLAEEVEALADSSRGRFRKRLRKLADRLRQGARLSEALETLPGLVPSQSVTAIRVGEELGNLAAVVQQEALRLRRAQDCRLQGRLSPAGLVFYLWCSLVVMLSIVGYMMYHIVPKLKIIFRDFATELPTATKMLIAGSEITVDYAPFVLFWMAAVLAVPIFILIRRGGFAGLDWSLVSAAYPRLETPGVLRNLAQAVAVRRPLTAAVSGMELHHRRRHVRKRMGRVRAAVDHGRDCFEPLQHSGFLKESEAAALASAERTGNLGWALDRVADAIDRRHRAFAQAAAETIQPLIVIMLGLLISFVCIGFFIPLVKLISAPTVLWN